MVVQKQQAEFTSRQVRREAHLRRLAVWPREALSEWRRLNSAEQTIVAMSMLFRYGEPFVRDFLSHARRRRRSEPTIHVTNVPRPAPRQLESSGYRRVGIIADIEKWVHPSGDEYWFLPSARERPQEPQERQQETSPTILDPQRRPTGQNDIENPPRIDPNIDPETAHGTARRSRGDADIMGRRGYATEYADGTIMLFPEGSTEAQTYRPRPSGGYDFYDENGERAENVIIAIDPGELFGSEGSGP